MGDRPGGAVEHEIVPDAGSRKYPASLTPLSIPRLDGGTTSTRMTGSAISTTSSARRPASHQGVGLEDGGVVDPDGHAVGERLAAKTRAGDRLLRGAMTAASLARAWPTRSGAIAATWPW